jgi:gamma-glutamyltranspeptidase/glutathione hydrolase
MHREQKRHAMGPLRGAFVFLCLAILSLPAVAVGPGRHAVATAHPLATDAGIAVLEQGGNAFDAAVAVTAVLGVVEPYSSGLGGGGFYLLHRAEDGFEVMVDAREKAPEAASADMYLAPGGEVVPRASIDGPLAAGIPGIPAALEHLANKYGRKPLRQLLQPAIELATKGFEVDTVYRRLAEFRKGALAVSPAAAAIFLTDGEVPGEGAILRQTDLATTLQRIAAYGARGFYEGTTASRLVDGVREAGGIWSAQDLRAYRLAEREPIRFEFGDLRVVSASPPSSGGVALATMFNILAGYDLWSLDAITTKHLIIESMRRAYRDRAEHLGDPDFWDVPVDLLTSPAYAAGLRASIRKDIATESAALPSKSGAVRPGGVDTTHFSILDKDGNRVAATLSINYPFGSAFVPPGTGVLLNDEMDDFVAKPGVPNVYGLVGGAANAIAPGKRMLSSMSPTFLETGDRMAIVGTPGGSRIITMVLLAALTFDEGGDAETMVSRPRFHHQYLPDKVFYEPGALTGEEVAELALRGHELELVESGWGNMQAIVWDKAEGRVEAAPDPRGIGKGTIGK